MRVSYKLRKQKKQWSEEREEWNAKHIKGPVRTVADAKLLSLSKKERREFMEGDATERRLMLDHIYKRDKGICYSCGEWLPREAATREHLFRPMSEYPHLAKNPIYIALAHKECNK